MHDLTKAIEAMKYLILIEKTNNGYSAFSPDLPGWKFAGPTSEFVKAQISQDIDRHLTDLLRNKSPMPRPTRVDDHIEMVNVHLEEVYFEAPKKGGSAQGCRNATGSGIIVYEGSLAARDLADSFADSYQPRRRVLIDDGSLVRTEYGDYKFVRDCYFDNPTEPADIVAGYHISGNVAWKSAEPR